MKISQKLPIALAGLLFVVSSNGLAFAMMEEDDSSWFEYSYSLTRDYENPSGGDYYEGNDWSAESIEAIQLPGDTTIRAMGTNVAGDGYINSVGARSSWTLGPGADTYVDYVSAQSHVSSLQQFTYDGGGLSFDFAWDGAYEWVEQFMTLPQVEVNFEDGGWFEYGYRISARAWSDSESFWMTDPEYGAWELSLLDEEVVVGDLSTAALSDSSSSGAYNFIQADAGKTFWVELTMETYLEGGNFSVTGDGVLINSVNFLDTFGLTDVNGATVVPEPTTLSLLIFSGLGLFLRRR